MNFPITHYHTPVGLVINSGLLGRIHFHPGPHDQLLQPPKQVSDLLGLLFYRNLGSWVEWMIPLLKD